MKGEIIMEHEITEEMVYQFMSCKNTCFAARINQRRFSGEYSPETKTVTCKDVLSGAISEVGTPNKKTAKETFLKLIKNMPGYPFDTPYTLQEAIAILQGETGLPINSIVVEYFGHIGEKTHLITTNLFIDNKRRLQIAVGYPYCGSAKWGGRQPRLEATSGIRKITCKKCGEQEIDLTERNAKVSPLFQYLGTVLPYLE